MKEFIKELKKTNGYDAIANNGHKYSNYELVSIIKETLYLVYSDYKNEINYKEFESKLADALTECFISEEELKKIEEKLKKIEEELEEEQKEKVKEKTKKFYVWYKNVIGKKVTVRIIESTATKEEIKTDLILQGVVFDGIDVVR